MFRRITCLLLVVLSVALWGASARADGIKSETVSGEATVSTCYRYSGVEVGCLKAKEQDRTVFYFGGGLLLVVIVGSGIYFQRRAKK